MSENSFLGQIQELNLTYLLLAKEMLSDDRASAIYRLGISEEIADIVANLSARQISEISRTNQLLCGLRFDDAALLQATLDSRRDYLHTPNHSAMQLASRNPSAPPLAVGE